MGLERRLRRLEEARHLAPEDGDEREKLLKEIREAAERENGRYLQEMIRERRGEFIWRVGVENVTREDMRDENYLTADDIPPLHDHRVWRGLLYSGRQADN